MRYTLSLLALCATLGFNMAYSSAALAEPAYVVKTQSTSDAAKYVGDVATQSLKILEDSSASAQEKHAQLKNLFQDKVAFDVIARRVMGTHWRALSPTQRTRFSTAYKSYVLDNYIQKLNDYPGGTIAILRTTALGKSAKRVSMRVERANGAPIMLDYVIKPQENGYVIEDIIVENVSLTITQREEFNNIIQRKGVDYLIERLEAKVK